jgi:hypothetical protein
MSFEPEKFFIGLMDFFAVLLPGALLTYLVKDMVGPSVLGSDYYRLGETEATVIFLFSAYLLGHFIFLIGAKYLDNDLYDPIRTATREGQIGRPSATGAPPMTKSRSTLVLPSPQFCTIR